MQEFQLKFQKAVVIGCLALSGVMIIYALGFSTDIYSLSYHANPDSALFYVPGAELYKTAQPFNRAFFTHAVLYFVLCLPLFLSLTHRRRLYYISNYVTSIVFTGFSVVLGAELIAHILEYRAEYLKVDFDRLKEVAEMMKMDFVKSTFMLDIGVALSVLLFAFAAALCVNLILKTYWMRREHWAEEESV